MGYWVRNGCPRQSLCIVGDLEKVLNLNLLESGCDNIVTFSITVDLENYTNKFITEAPITRERSKQRQESLTAQEFSMLRGVLGTASWKAQQMFCCGCEFIVECDGRYSGTGSSGCQQTGPRYASQFCTVSSFSLFQ